MQEAGAVKMEILENVFLIPEGETKMNYILTGAEC